MKTNKPDGVKEPVPETPKLKRHSRKLSDASIFNNIEINIKAPETQNQNVQSKEDGCTNCFKGIFKSLKK